MSYVRWGEGSSLYMYADTMGGVTCCGCSLAPATDHHSGWHGNFNTEDLDVMLAHLDAHRAQGDLFPDTLADYLRAGWPLAPKRKET